MHDVLDLNDVLLDELTQRREAGFDVSGLEEDVHRALANGSSPTELESLLRVVEGAPKRSDWPYEEPSTLAEINESLPHEPRAAVVRLDEATLRDRLQAAWLGRCAGCNLGKPVEGWDRADLRRYLELTGAYPLDDYIPSLKPMLESFELRSSWPECTRGRIRFMARDDDIDYTILGLHILETHGFDFGPEDVAEMWMSHIPFLATYTAERATYRNLVYGLPPHEVPVYRNPYREWIGAQIRADMWAYTSPGNPRAAATLAFQDASLSHVQNGIYGEMWAAALIAISFVAPDAHSALQASLAEVPPRSRLAEALRDVLELFRRGLDWEDARDALEERYGHYGFVHTINNAAVVAAALLWGEGDFTRTIGLAVQGGWDTDCNGATAGSTFGAMHGTEALPRHWIDPLNDLVRSAITGFDNSRISHLADRTLRCALTHGSPEEGREQL
jgi:ADP-ribosylglycohydrolase